MTDHAHTAAGPADDLNAIWLSGREATDLVDALAVAADTQPSCPPGACPDPDHHTAHTRAVAWRTLGLRLAALNPADPPSFLSLDEDAARAWLDDGGAEEYGIDESFNSHDLTIVARLEDVLLHLGRYEQPTVLRIAAPLETVQIWRTADGDGIDGGGIVSIDLKIAERSIRLATLHQGFDQFTDDEATSGIDAAVQALRHVVGLVNTEIRNHLHTVAARPPLTFTVVGIWRNQAPVPVGVITGTHHVVTDDDPTLDEGRWAITVTAPDPGSAQIWAVDTMRRNRRR